MLYWFKFISVNGDTVAEIESYKLSRVDTAGPGGRVGAAANKRRPVAGAVGLSFEKMQLVRQKKEEIEKVSICPVIQLSVDVT